MGFRPSAALLLVLALLAACSSRKVREESPMEGFTRELPPGELGLVPLPPGEPLPDLSIGWQQRDRLLETVVHSLDFLSRPSTRKLYPYGPITHERMVAGLERFRELLETSRNAEEFRRGLLEDFEVWMARGRDNSGDVLFTGYGRPILDGSRTRTDRFRYPLYRLPEDLVKNPDGKIAGRRTESGAVVPYYTRAELERNGVLQGKEIVWLADPFDAYVAHVQGSALIRLPDGKFLELGYAGKNGREYKSIGLQLVEEGKIPAWKLSLATLQQYFRKHPGESRRVLDQNPSFVFFQESPGGPFGSIGQPVVERRSLATDKAVFPPGGLAYVETRLPDFDTQGQLVQRPMRFFALDQDRGGAIRSAGRCDVFLGTGNEAMARAGHVLSVGRFYYLFLREEAFRRTIG